MKKKTALTLSVMALLSAGITLGVKIKDKRDKDEIEKTLKTVLIPNAEKELDKLTKENDALKDSISLYEAMLLRQSVGIDENHYIPKHHDVVGFYSGIRDVYNSLENVKKDWLKASQNLNKEISARNVFGDNPFDMLPETLKQRYVYLYSEMTASLNEADVPEIPGGYKQYYANGKYNNVLFDFWRTTSLDEHIEDLCNALRSTRGQFTLTGSQGNRVFYPIETAQEVKQLLIAIKWFAQNIDNSKGVIAPKHLDDVVKHVDALMPLVDKQINLENERDIIIKRLDGFKSGQHKMAQRVQQQQEKVKELRSADAVGRIYKQQRGKRGK